MEDRLQEKSKTDSEIEENLQSKIDQEIARIKREQINRSRWEESGDQIVKKEQALDESGFRILKSYLRSSSWILSPR